MHRASPDDTIAAIATPVGEGGIGIVRISGAQALSIAGAIFVPKAPGLLTEYATHTTHYGWIVSDPIVAGIKPPAGLVDEVLLTLMKAPGTYTREDVIEINCHGGPVPLERILELALKAGARMAEPGEFTRRAFQNGRIDLAQAEAVLDIIRARTERGLSVALLQLEGKLSETVAGLRRQLIDIKVRLESTIDFPDEATAHRPSGETGRALAALQADLERSIISFASGRIIRDGVTCVICGRPNVGKSSLMNAVLGEERVIVSPLPGTTRDAVSERLRIDGILVTLADTAGIAGTDNSIEKEGIVRSKLWLEKADLVLMVLDATTAFLPEDRAIVDAIRGKEVIFVVNKTDVASQRYACGEAIRAYLGRSAALVEVSALRLSNIDRLREAIGAALVTGKISPFDEVVLTNARHKDSFLKTRGFVDEAAASLGNGQPEEIVALSIDAAIRALGEVTGETVSQEVLDSIFSQFCIGK
ncbi:MAG: tRNA uridine-5-carboxymethylaminomethyl(34) synthesis GTPase MnmE [Candidatus Omnitrophota bacterium]